MGCFYILWADSINQILEIVKLVVIKIVVYIMNALEAVMYYVLRYMIL